MSLSSDKNESDTCGAFSSSARKAAPSSEEPSKAALRLPLVCIRADGNSAIATGHLARTLSIAGALAAQGARVLFVLADNDSDAVLAGLEKNRGLSFPHVILNCDYRDSQSELEALNLALTARETDLYGSGLCGTVFPEMPDFWLADSYFLTESYFTELRLLFRSYGSDTKTGYIDDLLTFPSDADLVINYDLHSPDAPFAKAEAALRGPQYCPLRPEFAAAAAHSDAGPSAHDGTHILLLTGGTDPLNAAGRLAEILACQMTDPQADDIRSEVITSDAAAHAASKGFSVTAVSGPLNTHYPELLALSEKHENIRVLSNVADMCSLMREADQAVTAGGTTLCELCAAGVPSLIFTMADNQIPMAEDFASTGLMSYMGDIRGENGDEVLKKTAQELISRAAHPEDLNATSEKLRRLIDGRGAQRIAQEILSLCTK